MAVRGFFLTVDEPPSLTRAQSGFGYSGGSYLIPVVGFTLIVSRPFAVFCLLARILEGRLAVSILK
jgi:hypothetical protein